MGAATLMRWRIPSPQKCDEEGPNDVDMSYLRHIALQMFRVGGVGVEMRRGNMFHVNSEFLPCVHLHLFDCMMYCSRQCARKGLVI